MQVEVIENQIQILKPYLSVNKWTLFQKIIQQRTRKLTVVLEDVYHEHNQSAILRTAECLGIQDIHFISNKYTFDISQGISRGSQKWLNIEHHQQLQHNTSGALEKLREKNYQIVVTKPPGEGVKTIQELNFQKPIALVMGTEKSGISEQAELLADKKIYFPMVGFTESLNVSVAFAIIANDILQHFKKETNDWQLTEYEQKEILLEWMKKCIRDFDKILYLSDSQ